MSAKKAKGLGRSFDSLIPSELLDESFDPTAAQDDKVSDLRQIKLSEIKADPDQPRRSFDEEGIAELAESIKLHGIVQPVVVMTAKGGYQIVAGERRFRAAQIAGLDKIPALVRTLTNQHKLEISLIENLQRRDLNPLETATAYLKLRDQFNLSVNAIGKRVGGRSPSTISNALRLLRLPESAKQALIDGKLREGQARPLINLDAAIIEEILPKILKEDWSARKIEQFVVQIKKTVGTPDEQLPKRKLSLIPYEQDVKRFTKRFKTDVKVSTTAKGAGKIVIRFKNDDEFQRIKKVIDS